MDNIAKTYNIKKPEEWSKYASKASKDKFFITVYSSSLYKALVDLYPGLQQFICCDPKETKWNKSWFKHQSRWANLEDVRKHFDKLGRKLGVKHPSDWGTVTSNDFLDHGSIFHIKKYGGIFKCLKTVYPGSRISFIQH